MYADAGGGPSRATPRRLAEAGSDSQSDLIREQTPALHFGRLSDVH